MPWTRKSSSNRKDIVHIVVTGYQKKKDPRKHYVIFTITAAALKSYVHQNNTLTHAFFSLLYCIQVFVTDITWNNNERYETYRRYSDFFSFQVSEKATSQSS